MTKKEMQQIKNYAVIEMLNDAMNEFLLASDTNVKRLRSCTAEVHETEHYYLLKSWNTFIAVINKDSLVLFDALRYVYTFTRSSAYHVAKFKQDYKADFMVTYRKV